MHLPKQNPLLLLPQLLKKYYVCIAPMHTGNWSRAAGSLKYAQQCSGPQNQAGLPPRLPPSSCIHHGRLSPRLLAKRPRRWPPLCLRAGVDSSDAAGYTRFSCGTCNGTGPCLSQCRLHVVSWPSLPLHQTIFCLQLREPPALPHCVCPWKITPAARCRCWVRSPPSSPTTRHLTWICRASWISTTLAVAPSPRSHRAAPQAMLRYSFPLQRTKFFSGMGEQGGRSQGGAGQ